MDPERKIINVVGAAIVTNGTVLCAQRGPGKSLAGYWEFPGGKVEAGETLPQALQRECMEELAVKLDVRDRFMQVEHKYPDIFIRLTLFHCVISEGVPQALEHNALRWIHPSETKNFTFCPADADILKEIDRVYGGSKPL